MEKTQLTAAIEQIKQIDPNIAEKLDESIVKFEAECVALVDFIMEATTNGIYEITMAQAGGKRELEELYESCVVLAQLPFSTSNALNTERLDISAPLIVSSKLLKSSIQLPGGDQLSNQPMFELESIYITLAPTLLGMIEQAKLGNVPKEEPTRILFSIGSGGLIKHVMEFITMQQQMNLMNSPDAPQQDEEGNIINISDLVQ